MMLYYCTGDPPATEGAFLSTYGWYTSLDDLLGPSGTPASPPAAGDELRYGTNDWEFDPENNPGEYGWYIRSVPNGTYGIFTVTGNILSIAEANENGDTNLIDIASGNWIEGNISHLWYWNGELANDFHITRTAPWEYHFWINGVDNGLYDADGYNQDGFDINGDAWPSLLDMRCYVGGELANGLNTPSVGSHGWDLTSIGTAWFVNGVDAAYSSNGFVGLNNGGTGHWDGYSAGLDAMYGVAGVYIGGNLQTLPTSPYVFVTLSDNPLANGYYIIGTDPNPSLEGSLFFATNSSGYVIRLVGDHVTGEWQMFDPLDTVFVLAADLDSDKLFPEEVMSWRDALSGGASGAIPAFQTLVPSSSADIIISGFPSSATIFGAGFLAA